MIWCKKKSGLEVGKLVGIVLAVFGAMTALFLAYKCLKKHLPRLFGKEKMGIGLDFPDIDFTLDEDNVHGGHAGCCTVVHDDNDSRSRGNAVVNSENRMLNIENEDADE